jgi:hypothetical protein
MRAPHYQRIKARGAVPLRTRRSRAGVVRADRRFPESVTHWRDDRPRDWRPRQGSLPSPRGRL